MTPNQRSGLKPEPPVVQCLAEAGGIQAGWLVVKSFLRALPAFTGACRPCCPIRFHSGSSVWLRELTVGFAVRTIGFEGRIEDASDVRVRSPGARQPSLALRSRTALHANSSRRETSRTCASRGALRRAQGERSYLWFTRKSISAEPVEACRECRRPRRTIGSQRCSA